MESRWQSANHWLLVWRLPGTSSLVLLVREGRSLLRTQARRDTLLWFYFTWALGREVGQSIARKLGKELGGSAGFAAGRISGARAAVEAAKAEAAKLNLSNLSEEALEQLLARVRETAAAVAKEAATISGEEAGSQIDIDFVVSEVIQNVKKAAEEQAYEYKAFESLCADIAREAGEKSGKVIKMSFFNNE